MEGKSKRNKGIKIFLIIISIVIYLLLCNGLFMWVDRISNVKYRHSSTILQEDDYYNASMNIYVGEARTGLEVTKLIDAVIERNKKNFVNNYDGFVVIEYKNFENTSLIHVPERVIGDPERTYINEAYLRGCTESMLELKESVNTIDDIRYKIEEEHTDSGLINKIIITELH